MLRGVRFTPPVACSVRSSVSIPQLFVPTSFPPATLPHRSIQPMGNRRVAWIRGHHAAPTQHCNQPRLPLVSPSSMPSPRSEEAQRSLLSSCHTRVHYATVPDERASWTL